MGDLRKVILIVDDIELNRAILKELFFQSYCVAEAENGLQALEAIKNMVIGLLSYCLIL